GGSGKTRLAIELALGLVPHFPDGVRFVGLAPIGEPELVLPTIARALGVDEAGGRPLLELLQASLRERRVLLLIDNFEHLLEAAPIVAELLAAAPKLTVLVTSRAALRLQGEHEYPVAPLPVPDPASVPVLAPE